MLTSDLKTVWVGCIAGNIDPDILSRVSDTDLGLKDEHGRSAASRAAIWGRTEVLAQLQKRGLDIGKEIDDYGNTLLHISAGHCQHDSCSFLMSAGLSGQCLNKAGLTALQIAERLPEDSLNLSATIAVLKEPPKPASKGGSKSPQKSKAK